MAADMPFQSEKQRRYLWANEPEVATKWSRKYGSKPVDNRSKKKKKSFKDVATGLRRER